MSRTIDERVVKMEFDNQRFESNVKESLSTIDKLKKSMDFDSAKAFGNIDKAASKVSFNGLLSGIETVRSKFSMLDVASYTMMSRLTNSLIDFGKKIVTAIPSQIKEGGVSRALNIEQAKFQLEGLKVSWDSIKDDIEYGVKDTAYGLDEAAKAASQLVASGVKVGDEMKNTLRGISGVAAMTNSSYSEIGHIFTTTAGQGKVMTMQLRELENRGLNAAASIRTYFNQVNAGEIEVSDSAKQMVKDITNGTQVTEEQIRDMVTKGKISFKAFSEAMNTTFGEHATAANQTFSGALANMKAALSRIGADFAAPAFRNLRDIFNELRNTFNNVRTALGPVVDVFDRLSTAITKSLVGSLKNFNEWFSKFGGKQTVIESINWALSALLSRLIPIKKAFETVFPKSTVNTLDGMASAVERFTKSLMPTQVELEALYYIFVGLFNTIKIIGKLLKTIAAGLVKFGPVLAPLTTLVGLFVIFGMTLGKIVPKIASFINIIRTLLPLLKVLGIVAAGALAVLAGITIVKTIVTNFDKIKAAFKSLGLSISNWFNDLKSKYPLLQKISDFFAGLGVKLKNVGSAIAQFAKMAYNAFSQNGFIGGFKKLGEQLRATVEGVNRVKRRSVEMADAYNLAAKRTGKAVSVTIGEEETTFQKFAATLLGIGDKIKWFFANIKNILTVDNIKKGFHNLGETMYNTFTKIGDVLERSGVADKLRETGSAIVDFVKNLNYGKIAAIGFATALITLIFRFSSMFKGIGTLTREAGLFLKSLRGGLFNIKLIRPDYTSSLNKLALGLAILAGSLTLLIALYGQHPQELVNIAAILGALGLSLLGFALIAGKLGAFKSFSMTMLSLSAGIGILVASLLILDHVNMDTIFEKVSVLAGIAIALAVAMKIIGKMEKSSVTNIFFAIAFAASVAILIKSLVKAFQALKGYSWQEMIIAAGGIAGVIGMLAVLASNMSKVKNFGSTLGILAFTAFMAVFGKSLATVFDALPPDKLEGYLKAIDAYKEVAIGIGVLAVIMLGVASKAGEGMQKLGTGLLAMAAAIGVLAFVVVKMTEWAKTLTEADVDPVLAALGIVAALILLCAGFQRLSTKTVKLGESVKQANMGWTFLAMAAAILAMGKAMEMIADIPQEKYGQALGALATMGAILAGVTALSFLSEKANTRAILAVAVVIGSISLSLMLLSLFSWDDIIPGLLSLSVCMGVFALILWSMNNLKPNKNAVKTLIPIAIMLGVLGAELAVLSNLPWPSVAAAGAAMTAALYSLSKVIKAVSGNSGLGGKTADKKFKNLMAITLMLTAIGVSLVALSYQPWGQIATAGAGMVACMYMLTKVIKSVSDLKTGSCEKKISILREVSIMMAALGAALWIASQNHWSQIAAAGAAMTAVMYVLTKIIKVINDTKPNEKATKQLAQVAAILIEIAIPMAALSFLDIAGMATAAGLMTGVIIALALISSKIGNTKVKTSAVKQLAELAAILIEIAIPMAALSFLDIGKMAASAGLMVGVMLALVGISKLIEKAKIKADDVWNMVEMAAAMLLVAGSMALLGSVISDPGSMIAAAGALAIAIGAISLSLGLLANFTQGMDLIATSGAIAIVAAACVGLAAAAKILEGVDWETFKMMAASIGMVVAIVAGLGIVVGVLTYVVGAGLAIGTAMLAVAGAFAIFSAGVLALGLAMTAAGVGIKIGAEGLEILLPVLQEMVTLPIGDMAKSLLTLSLGLASLGIAGLGMLVGAAGFAAFALAIRAGFIPAMLELARIGNEELVPLAANIRTLVDAFKPMEELSAVLIPVGVAFTLFGAAIALAGIGIYAGAQGLYTLAPALQQLQPLLTEDFITQMLRLAVGLGVLGASGVILGFGALGLNMGGTGLVVLAQGLAAINNVAADAGSIGAAMEAVSTGLQKIGQAGMTLAFGAMGLIMGGAGLLVLLPSLMALSSGDIDMAKVGQQFETLAQGATSFAKAGMLLLVGAPGVLAAAAAILVLGSSLNTFQAQFTTAVTNMDKTIANMSKQSLNTAKTKYKTVGQAMPQSVAAGIQQASPKMQVAAKKAGSSVERVIKQSTGGGTTSSTNIFGMIGQAITGSLGMGMEKNEGGILSNVGSFADNIKGILSNIGQKIMNLFGLSNGLSGLASQFGLVADQYDERGFKMNQGAITTDNILKVLTGDSFDLNEQYEKMMENMEDVTGGLGDMGGAAGKASNSFSSLKDTIEQQMDIFSEFNMKTEITGDQMLANMRSQVQGVAQWAANLQMLAARGIDQGLLAKLSELGPQGYEKVAAFVQMTDAQLQEANQLYATSLMLPSSAAAQITGSFAMAGRDATQGFLNGWSSEQIAAAMLTGAQDSLNAFTGPEGLDEHSPSRKTEQAGQYAMQGFKNGIEHYAFMPINSMKSTAQKIVRAARETLTYAEFRTIGENVMKGLHDGLDAGSDSVIAKMNAVADALIAKANSVLEMGSPSRVFYSIGRFVDLGLRNGIAQNAYEPVNAMDDLTNQLTYKLGSIAMTINELLNEDLDAQPTITPVLDLTNLQNGIGVASSLLASRTVRLSATQASIQNGTGSAEIKTNDSGNTVYTFTQNNYSPKALDRSEIYRQTRNQFSQIKQARV